MNNTNTKHSRAKNSDVTPNVKTCDPRVEKHLDYTLKITSSLVVEPNYLIKQ